MTVEEFFELKHPLFADKNGNKQLFTRKDLIIFAEAYYKNKIRPIYHDKKVEIESALDLCKRIYIAVEKATGVTKEQMVVTRKKEILLAKHTAIWLIKKYTGLSLTLIGRQFSRYVYNRKTKKTEFAPLDHSTIKSSLSKIEIALDVKYKDKNRSIIILAEYYLNENKEVSNL
jgi:chromosomal replication initiation ATPase DnaA